MTDTDLITLLDRLLALPAETELLEFKTAGTSFGIDDLGRYFSALSNEANLHRQDQAWLIFGVNDKRQVVGTQYRPSRPGLDSLKGEVAAKTSNNLSFIEIHEVVYAGQRLVLFEIPPALPGVPTAWQGHYYGRNGESLTALSLEKLERIRAQAAATRFEREIALKGQSAARVLELLDYSAFFRLFKLPLPTTQAGLLEKLAQRDMIQPRDAVYDITNLGALLFAQNLGNFERLGRKAIRLIFYQGRSKVRTLREVPAPRGYALEFEGLVRTIGNMLPGNVETKVILREQTAPSYPPLVLSELIANALIHQDFLAQGVSPQIDVFENRIEITNPGQPLIDERRFIDHAPRSRNELLAGAMRQLDMCEERGSGIDKVVQECEEHHLPAPRFEASEQFTRVVLFSARSFGEMDRQDKVRACYQHACLKQVSGESMTNQSLRERLGIAESNYPAASRIITDTMTAGLLKPLDPTSKSRKHARYLPYWA